MQNLLTKKTFYIFLYHCIRWQETCIEWGYVGIEMNAMLNAISIGGLWWTMVDYGGLWWTTRSS